MARADKELRDLQRQIKQHAVDILQKGVIPGAEDVFKGLQFNARNTYLLTDALCTNPVTGKTGPGYGIPCALLDRVTSGGVGFYSDYLDPNFKIPKNIKTSFGLRGSFDLDLVDGLLIDDIGFYVDYISGRSVNAY